jgi:hypothetical protein
MSPSMTVIHASRSTTSISAQIYSGLDDQHLIATSSSAYNTQDIFYQYILDFQKMTKVISSTLLCYFLIVTILLVIFSSFYIYPVLPSHLRN